MNEPKIVINRNISSDGDIWLITINRQNVRNAVDKETAELLGNAFVEFEKDEKARISILYGAGGNFCSGADLNALSESNDQNGPKTSNSLLDVPKDFEIDSPVLDTTGPMGVSRMLLSKPVIAAVSGYAVAGGLELACWCDLRVADSTAIFGVFCRRFGVPLIDGGTKRLTHIVGLSRAMDMILTGRSVDVIEAHQFGLVNRIVDLKDQKYLETKHDKFAPVLIESIELANLISKFPQYCLKADRMSVYRGLGLSWREALIYEFKTGKDVVSKEGLNGAKKFKSGDGRHGKINNSKL